MVSSKVRAFPHDKWRLIRRLSQRQGWRVIGTFDTLEKCLAERGRFVRNPIGIPVEDIRVLSPAGEDYYPGGWGLGFGDGVYE